jgi:hypothetical protein
MKVIPIEYVKATCKLGKPGCCMYLVETDAGTKNWFECAKGSKLHSLILNHYKDLDFYGDNCPGYEVASTTT